MHPLKTFFCAVLLLLCLRTFAQEQFPLNTTGIYTGLNVGTWFPDGKNKVLGNASFVGFTLELKAHKNAFAINFDLIGVPFGKTTETVYIQYKDSLLARHDYGGAQITLDYCRQLAASRNFIFEVMSGLGYGDISYYNPSADIDVHKSSLVFSPGISGRFVIRQHVFAQLKVQYNMANYALKDNTSTSFKGNYLTTKLILGVYKN